MERENLVCLSRLTSVTLALFSLFGVMACGGDEADNTLLSDIESRGMIRVASDPGWPPQSERAQDGTWSGFDVLVAEEIGRRLGVTVQYATPDWDDITAGNWRDQWDISVGSMTITDARKQVLHFVTPPYYYDTAFFFTKPTGGIEYAAIVTGTKVCVTSSSTWESWITGTLTLPAEQILTAPPATGTVTVITEQDEGNCPTRLATGTVDMFINSFGPNSAAVQANTVKTTGPKLFVEHLAVAVDKSHSKDPASLVQKLGTIVQAMHDDGTLAGYSNSIYGIDLTKTQ